MKKKLFLTDFYLLKIFAEPTVLLSTGISVILILISSLFFGVQFQKSLRQINSYSKSDFKIIEKTSNEFFDNQLFDVSDYYRFHIDSKPKKTLHFESYLKLDKFNYSENIISGANINDLRNDEILISKNIADEYKLTIGDKIRGSNTLFSEKEINYSIAGILDNFYGLKEFPSDYQGVVILGDYPSYTKHILKYTFFNINENQSFGSSPVTVYQLIEKVKKNCFENFLIFFCFVLLGNISWIEFIFMRSFKFLKLVKGIGGRKYKLLLMEIHIFEIMIFSIFCFILEIFMNNIDLIILQFVSFIILNLFLGILNLIILRRKGA